MSDYDDLIVSLRKKVGPLTLEEIINLQENISFPENALAPGSAPRGVAAVLADQPVSVKNFGVVADFDGSSGTSIASGLTTALANSNNIYFPPGDYYVSGNTTIEVASNAKIDFGQARLFFAGTASLSINSTLVASTTLDGAITKDATSCVVASATGIVAGSLLRFFENTVAESTFGAKRNAIVQVRSVSGTTITFAEPIGMPFATGITVTVRNPRRLILKSPNVYRVGATAGAGTPGYDGMLQLGYWVGLSITDLTISSDQAYSATGEQDGNGILIDECIGAEVNRVEMSNVSYGISLPNCRNTLIRGIDANNVRHPVVPGNWSRNSRIENLRSRDCYSTIDSHTAFDTHYRDVRGYSDAGLSNLRCVGGSLTDVDVTTVANDAVSGPFWQNLALTSGHTDFYDNAFFDLDRVRLSAPNRSTDAVISATYGHVRARDVIAFAGTASAWASTVGSLEFQNCRNADRTPWPTNIIRKLPAPVGTGLIDAELDSSVYHINPRKYPVPQTARFLRCSGLLVAGVTSDATALTVRIHTSCWAGTPIPVRVLGEIRFTMHLTHSNSGSWSNQIKQYGFNHRIASTSGITMPVTPDFVSDLTGVTNESASMTLSAPTQQGVTQLGSGAGFDYYTEFTLTLTSGGRTSPIMDVWYDLAMTVRPT